MKIKSGMRSQPQPNQSSLTFDFMCFDQKTFNEI